MVAKDFLDQETLQRWAAALGATEGFALSTVQLALLEEEIKEAGQETTMEKYLHSEERKRFESFTTGKRRLEWLGGRIAAKHAAGSLISGFTGTVPWLEFIVSANARGKPALTIAKDREAAFIPEISISHSGGRALAMAAKRPCGVDIQQSTASVLKVANRFSSNDERSLLANCYPGAANAEIGRLTLLWSAKEAIRKMVAIQPLIGFMELKLINATSPWGGQEGVLFDFACSRHMGVKSKQPEHIKVMAQLEVDFAVAVTINDLER